MTKFENTKNMNIDQFAEWLNLYGNHYLFDTWFAEQYCENCDRITDECGRHDYAYCELNGDCKIFPGHCVTENNIYAIKLWLSQEEDKENT